MIPDVLLWLLLAQSASAPPAAAKGDAASLARGWTAIAAGRSTDAAQIANTILATKPWSHAAVELLVAARARQSPTQGLDAYEKWLGQRADDPGLLEPVAVATLERLFASTDAAVVAEARRQLENGGSAQKSEAERLRLEAAAQSDMPDKTAIAEGLGDAGPAAIPALSALLQASQGPNRAAAAAALGRLQARDAEQPLLEALKDDDPFVRSSAAVALARIGNSTGRTYVEQMLTSPVPDLRLMAAEAWDGATGPWVEAIRPLLQDDNPLVRVRAAALLAPIDPEGSREALSKGLADPNPVIRAESGKRMTALGQTAASVTDIVQLRATLRDPDPWVRLYAAGTLLKVIRAPR